MSVSVTRRLHRRTSPAGIQTRLATGKKRTQSQHKALPCTTAKSTIHKHIRLGVPSWLTRGVGTLSTTPMPRSPGFASSKCQGVTHRVGASYGQPPTSGRARGAGGLPGSLRSPSRPLASPRVEVPPLPAPPLLQGRVSGLPPLQSWVAAPHTPLPGGSPPLLIPWEYRARAAREAVRGTQRYIKCSVSKFNAQ